MLSETDTRTIDACRQVLSDLATAAKAEAMYGGLTSPAEVFTRGFFAAGCASAEGHLSALLQYAATYLDDVHAAASLPRDQRGVGAWRDESKPGPRPLEP